jgi:hypothetical protein
MGRVFCSFVATLNTFLSPSGLVPGGGAVAVVFCLPSSPVEKDPMTFYFLFSGFF